MEASGKALPWSEEIITGRAYVCAKLLQLCPTLCDPLDVAHQVPLFMGFSKQEYWSRLGCNAPLQGIFLTQGLNLCLLRLLHCRQFFTTEPPGRPFALIMAIDGCEVHNCCPHLATSLMTEKPRVKRTIGKQGSTTRLTQLSVLYLDFQLCNVVYKFKVEDSNS